MARRGGASRARAKVLAICASAVLHLAILALLFWSTDSRRPKPEPPPIFVSLLRQDLPRQAAANSRPKSTSRLRQPTAAGEATTPAATPGAPTSPPASGPADDSQRAARAALLSLGESVRCAHPDAFKMDATEREQCQHAASEIARDGPVYAALPADPVKAAALERAARRNEAWRQYLGSSGKNDYPGLLTLFGYDAEPCPPGDADAPGLPKCWRRIP